MLDIFLNVSDETYADYLAEADRTHVSVEDLMRQALIAARPRYAITRHAAIASSGELAQEPIVQAAEIEKEYQRLGYSLGWRLLSCPLHYRENSKLLLFGVNPGGRSCQESAFAQDEGSSYRVEAWEGKAPGDSRLQKQILEMYRFLSLADDEVFSGYFVPFRSPRWTALDNRHEALEFSSRLWSRLIPTIAFERVVCMGKGAVADRIAKLFGARFQASFPIGWGHYVADRYKLPDGRPMIALPHLSIFSVFGRPESQRYLTDLFAV